MSESGYWICLHGGREGSLNLGAWLLAGREDWLWARHSQGIVRLGSRLEHDTQRVRYTHIRFRAHGWGNLAV